MGQREHVVQHVALIVHQDERIAVVRTGTESAALLALVWIAVTPAATVRRMDWVSAGIGKGSDINQFSPGSMTVPLLQDAALDADWVWSLSTMPQLSADIFPGIPPPRCPLNDFLSSMDQMSSSQDISPPTLTQDLESTDDEEQSAVTTELSARLGALVFTGDDDPHYYGATSNLSLVRSRVAHISAGALHNRTVNAQEILDAQGLGQAIEQTLVDRLVSLYFTWHEPSMHTVDREAFEDARRRYHDENIESTFFSLMLLNAMSVLNHGDSVSARLKDYHLTDPEQ